VSGGLDHRALRADLEASFEEVARTALTQEPVRKGELAAPLSHWRGAYIGLVAPQGAFQVGIAADDAGCQLLARSLLSMPESDPPLADAELADAVCEIANIVAGGFKGRVREQAGPLTLGLPVFFHGPAQATEHTGVLVSVVGLGSTSVGLLIVHPRVRG
jgi:hypothetical protein